MSYTCKGDYENALLQHHKSLEIKLRIYGNKPVLVAESYHAIASVYVTHVVVCDTCLCDTCVYVIHVSM